MENYYDAIEEFQAQDVAPTRWYEWKWTEIILDIFEDRTNRI